MKIRGSLWMLIISGIIATSNCDAGTGEKAQGVADQRPFETPLPVNTRHQKLALGMQASVGVKEDGTVWSWGTASYGELGTGERSDKRPKPEQIKGLSEIVEVSGRSDHFLALRKDGIVFSWGLNDSGQLGYVTPNNFFATPKQIPGLTNIVSISAGSAHSLAVDSQGRIYGFGDAESKQLGMHISAVPQRNPKSVSIPAIGQIPSAVRVVASSSMNAVLTKSGELWLMGHDSKGELGCATTERSLAVFRPCSGITVSSVALGSVTTFVLDRNGFTLAMGFNTGGQLGRGFADQKAHPELEKVHGLGRVTAIAATISSAYAVDEKGRLWSWGTSAGGPPSELKSRKDWQEPRLVSQLEQPAELYGGPGRAAILEANGHVSFVGSAKGMVRGTGETEIKETEKTWLTPQRSLWMWK